LCDNFAKLNKLSTQGPDIICLTYHIR